MARGIINWKMFWLLLSASVVSALLVIPYSLASLPEPVPVTPFLVLAAAIQNLILFGIAVFFGLLLSGRAGLGRSILRDALEGKRRPGAARSMAPLSVGAGAGSGALIILMDLPFQDTSVALLSAEGPAWWLGLLASFYGGIAEEILCRLFLVSLLVWITLKIRKTSDGAPTDFRVWLSIVLAAVLFGLGHLPATGAVTAITPIIVVRAVLLNAPVGVVCGWLYWQKGLEAAMIAHFSADVVLHVIAPAAVSLLGA